MTAVLPANQVLVTVGTGSIVSPLGRTEAHRAFMVGDQHAIGYAAADANLVTVDVDSPADAPVFRYAQDFDGGAKGGQPVSVEGIEQRWGKRLRENIGTRHLPNEMMAAHVPTTIGGLLAHDLEKGSEVGGLRYFHGTTFKGVRKSGLKSMGLLFDDDPRLGPSLQSQVFMESLLAFATLDKPLSSLIEASQFKIGAGACFFGHDAWYHLGNPERRSDFLKDRAAYRLASVLHTHGPALVASMLAPDLPITKYLDKGSMKQDKIHAALQSSALQFNVPQDPLVVSSACASILTAFCHLAPSLLFDYPGVRKAELALLMGGDAAVSYDARILEGFGPRAMVTPEDLKEKGRPVSESICPFDEDAMGTLVSHVGGGIAITTLEFALKHKLDVTSIIAGWGSSSESGGKGHFAGIGFGGENAIISALEMAKLGHGFGLENFGHLIAHATGTRSNAKTDLGTNTSARRRVAEQWGYAGRLPELTVGAPKASLPSVGHPMGPAGLLALLEGVHYVMGQPSAAIGTLKKILPDIADDIEAGNYVLQSAAVQGSHSRGVILPVQGFGGFNAAMLLMPATEEILRRYVGDDKDLDAYVEGQKDIREGRIKRETAARRKRGSLIELAETHRWKPAT